MPTYTTSLPEVLEPWVTEIVMNQFNQLEPIFPKLFNMKTSTKAFEDTFEVSGLGTFRLKAEGTPVSYDDPVQSLRKRIVFSVYALGFRCSMEMMEDDQHGVIEKMASDLGESARDHKENIAWGVVNDAFTGTLYKGIPEGDGTARALVSTGHIGLKDGATRSNRLSPDVAFSVSGLQAAITNYRLTKGQSGRQIRITPSVVVHHPNDEFAVVQVLDSTLEPFTADNQVNAVSRSRMGLTTLSVPYLTDTDNWLLCANKSSHTLKWYDRKEFQFDRNKDAQTKDSLWDGMYRGAATFENWYGVVGSAP